MDRPTHAGVNESFSPKSDPWCNRGRANGGGVADPMKMLFDSGKLLLLDMASTFFFLIVFLLTHNITLSVVLGMALGAAQIGWQFARGRRIDTMQWLSLFLV